MLNYLQERIKRASLHQKEAMIQFMEKHPEIGNERMSSNYDIFYRKEKWAELTRLLNKLPGKPKTPGKWQKAWQDWRYNTRKKVSSRSRKHKLSNMEQRLLAITDSYNLPRKNNTMHNNNAAGETSNMEKEEQVDENEDDNSEWNKTLSSIKQENEETSNEDIGNLLETSLIELPSEQSLSQIQIANVTTMNPESQKKIKNTKNTKKRYTFNDSNNVRQINRVAKCVEKSLVSVKKICRTQIRTSSKLVSLLEENSRTLQSLAESQMRQAEALERQVSLEESRNSILKGIAAALSALKKT